MKNKQEEVTMEGNSLQIAQSKTGHLVPVINNHYLHSMQNPVVEAADDIKKKADSLKNANHILVLGLGFAYHVEEIKKVNPLATIWVLEPNMKLIQKYLELNTEPMDVKFHCEPELTDLFMTDTFIDFLVNKPTIYCHKNSFEANQSYFKGFLNYKASSFTSDYIKSVSEDFRGYLATEVAKDNHLTLEKLISEKQESRYLTKNDHLVLALNNIINS